MNKINKRTLILVFVILLFVVFTVMDNIKDNKDNEEAKTQIEPQEHEQYLDNGIGISDLVKEGRYLEEIVITSIVFENGLEYTLKNNGTDSVYIANEIQIVIGEDNFHLSDNIKGKIELAPLEEKTITTDITLNRLSADSGYYIDVTQITLLKPIYEKYDNSKLIGIAKSENWKLKSEKWKLKTEDLMLNI